MARIVLDTNVLVSAFIVSGGRSGEVVGRVIDGLDELFISQAILDELKRVLVGKLGLESSLCFKYEDLIKRNAKVVRPVERLSVIPADESDNRILECAVQAEA